MSTDPEAPFPDSAVSMALGVCDGQCVPDECVCPSAAQRVAEIQAAVKAERKNIAAWVRDTWAGVPEELQNAATNEVLRYVAAAIRRGDHA